MEMQVKIDGKGLERGRVVKSLGVLLDNRLQWNKQVKLLKRKACAGLASLRRLQHVLLTTIKRSIYSVLDTTLRLVFSGVVRLLKEVVPGDREDPEL